MIDVVSLTDFKTQVLDSDLPVFVDFWAPWCGPCRTLAPVFEMLSQECTNVKFVKVNVDESDVAGQYNIRSIPTLMMFRDGKPVQTVTGVQSKAKLESIIQAQT